MVRRRRRPLRRAAMVGGTVDGTGLKAQREREQALQAPAGGVSEAATDQLEQLQESGVLTQDELDDQMRRPLQGA
jgi:hypothetical protein